MHLSCCIKLHRRPTTSIDEVLHGRSDSSLLHVPSHTTKLEPLASSTHSTSTASPPPTHRQSIASRPLGCHRTCHSGRPAPRGQERRPWGTPTQAVLPLCWRLAVARCCVHAYMHVQRKGCRSTGTGIGEEWCVSGGALPRADEGAGAG